MNVQFGLIQYGTLSKNRVLTEEWVMNMPSVFFFSIDYQGMGHLNLPKSTRKIAQMPDLKWNLRHKIKVVNLPSKLHCRAFPPS